jgi:hypothetical protein
MFYNGGIKLTQDRWIWLTNIFVLTRFSDTKLRWKTGWAVSVVLTV